MKWLYNQKDKLALFLILAGLVAFSSPAWALEETIFQDGYQYESSDGVVKWAPSDTFVIGIKKELPKQTIKKTVRPKPKIQKQIVRQKMEIPSIIYFDFGSSQVKKDQISVIKQAIQRSSLEKEDVKITATVKGFTCNVGPQDINDDLANARAEAVAKELQAAGLEVEVSPSKGKDGFIYQNKKRLNRRAEIEIEMEFVETSTSTQTKIGEGEFNEG